MKLVKISPNEAGVLAQVAVMLFLVVVHVGCDKDKGKVLDIDVKATKQHELSKILNDKFVIGIENMRHIPHEVLVVAADNVDAKIRDIDGSARPLLGFAVDAGVDGASLGYPYENLVVSYSRLLDADEKVDNYFLEKPSWLVPITYENRKTSTLRVSWHAGEWQTVAIGGARFALRAEKIETTYGYKDTSTKRAFVEIPTLDFALWCFAEEEYEKGDCYCDVLEKCVAWGIDSEGPHKFKQVLPKLIDKVREKEY